jgi:hypothetical protein
MEYYEIVFHFAARLAGDMTSVGNNKKGSLVTIRNSLYTTCTASYLLLRKINSIFFTPTVDVFYYRLWYYISLVIILNIIDIVIITGNTVNFLKINLAPKKLVTNLKKSHVLYTKYIGHMLSMLHHSAMQV